MPKYSKNRGVVCHVTRDKMALSEVISDDWRSCLFSGNLKPLFKRKEGNLTCLSGRNTIGILKA